MELNTYELFGYQYGTSEAIAAVKGFRHAEEEIANLREELAHMTAAYEKQFRATSNLIRDCEALEQKVERAEARNTELAAMVAVMRQFALGIAQLLTPEDMVCVDGHERLGHILTSIKRGVLSLREKADRLEARIAEAEKQEPVGYTTEHAIKYGRGVFENKYSVTERVVLYTRPIPPADVAEQIAKSREEGMKEGYNLGRQHQRESDAALCVRNAEFLKSDKDGGSTAYRMCAEDIENNKDN